MIRYFTSKRNGLALPIKKYTRFDYLRNRYQLELEKIKAYYRERDTAINNNHILSKIIDLLDASISLDINKYYEIVDTQGPYVCRQLGLVSNINNGEIFENIFYKQNSYEIINYVTNDIITYELETDWKNRECLKVTYTDETDLDFHLLNGSKSKYKESLTVFELDVPMMLLMYRSWSKARLRENKSTDSNVFISTIVIPNALNNMLDLVLFNRFMCITNNINIPLFRIKHPIPVFDYSYGIDKIYKEVVKDVYNNNIYLDQMMSTIPCMFNSNMKDTLFINRPYPNRQSEWVIWLARIKHISFILNVLGYRGIAKNKDVFNSLPYLLKELKNRSTNIYSKLNGILLNNFIKEVEEIEKYVGTR